MLYDFAGGGVPPTLLRISEVGISGSKVDDLFELGFLENNFRRFYVQASRLMPTFEPSPPGNKFSLVLRDTYK